ncbi:hypothetical protein [Minwuia thermotolerans]|uniref:hypothetical protein n=1 Tax=Minwuia thermotolerans TaxID=2056226 RepID=UPI000F630510|nr:hypothetical protein [Minwuia thermotolerans]
MSLCIALGETLGYSVSVEVDVPEAFDPDGTGEAFEVGPIARCIRRLQPANASSQASSSGYSSRSGRTH